MTIETEDIPDRTLMTIIAIHADRLPIARIEIDLDASTTDRSDPDFPVVTSLAGREVTLDAPVTGETVLGAFLDGAERLAISTGDISCIRISCGPADSYPVTDRDRDGTLRLERRGELLAIDTLPIGRLLTADQRRFLSRAPRER